ncbi:hypothetical protein ACE5JW_11815 [Acinetobacter radioresistens]|uniref:hypothetical protein n=1 Tax=Acinetobacter radioresistens TaxID=40216 RepID=UPI0002D01354|nr:hypothetical protein [Acinetobacter radioresistens]ENV88216.1 hypothetical protein F940_00062 [Acinetobacter radioresistens NIPH 2130]MCX0337538.1 hypothetical protein [Acinetobacter radioresistens]MCX0343112.1 hypothetical protein [Acinetobacter radioresistens]MCX0349009.1 hypothetical protein [Acinetobacter radioresistens]
MSVVNLRVEQIQAMIEHWLDTPANAYYGSSYGADLRKLLFVPMHTEAADSFLDKMKEDIPLLADLDSNALSIVSEDIDHDKKHFYIQLGSIVIPLGTKQESNLTGETYNAFAQ